MQLTIDNLDGHGPVDYSGAIDRSQPLEIVRSLNQPSLLRCLLCLAGTGLATPARRGRISAISEGGVLLFSGYVTVEPAPVYAGEATWGPVYRLSLSAVSDEWLLDKQSFGASGAGFGSDVKTYALRLAQQVAGSAPAATGASLRANGVFTPAPGGSWSSQVGAMASQTYSAYRMTGGSLAFTGAGGTEHTFPDGAGSFSLAALKTGSVRELANDVTVTGAEEPDVYFTEVFVGDGTTAVFNLTGEPSAPSAPSTGPAVAIDERFNGAAFNQAVWEIEDPGSYLSLTSSGLTSSGGNGVDGSTTFAAWNQIELGGTIVIELGAVSLAAATSGSGSAGVIGGLYQGLVQQAACFAGFNIRQTSSSGSPQTLATPMVNGVETGTSLTLLPGHQYTLRLHLHCPELLRLRQVYYAYEDSSGSFAVSQFGGGAVSAPVSLVFEARDQAASTNTPVTVLYDGVVAASPGTATFVALNSVNFKGSVGSVAITRTGSCWMRSIGSGGTAWTRLAGTTLQGVDCAVTSSAEGRVTFFPGRVPAAGEIVQIGYRGRRRSVARVADPASLAAEAVGGVAGTARWLGHVVQPPARTQEDCEFAAQAVLAVAGSRAAALSGSYTALNPAGADIWPGDALTFNTAEGSLNVLTRKVTVSEDGASPEVLTYRVAFANDWAETLSLSLTETLPTDTVVPPAALNLTAGDLPAHVVANLQQVAFGAPAGGALAVDCGLNPPPGGGFEVRRRDGGFGTGASGSSSGDLVLRSPVRGISIPLSAMEKAFYLRMYDASTPPLYSRNSAAILTHLPAS